MLVQYGMLRHGMVLYGIDHTMHAGGACASIHCIARELNALMQTEKYHDRVVVDPARDTTLCGVVQLRNMVRYDRQLLVGSILFGIA